MQSLLSIVIVRVVKFKLKAACLDLYIIEVNS